MLVPGIAPMLVCNSKARQADPLISTSSGIHMGGEISNDGIIGDQVPSCWTKFTRVQLFQILVWESLSPKEEIHNIRIL